MHQTSVLSFLLERSSNFRQKKATPKAHPRHTLKLLPLLPSGPGGVHSTILRGYQWSHQLQIIQGFLSITTPIAKLMFLQHIETSNLVTKSSQHLV